MQARYNYQWTACRSYHVGIELLVDGEIINLSDGGTAFQFWTQELITPSGRAWVLGYPKRFRATGEKGYDLFTPVLELSTNWQEVPEDLESWIVDQCGGWDSIRERAALEAESRAERTLKNVQQKKRLDTLSALVESVREQLPEFEVIFPTEVNQTRFRAIRHIRIGIGARKRTFDFTGTVPEILKAWEKFEAENKPLSSGAARPRKRK